MGKAETTGFHLRMTPEDRERLHRIAARFETSETVAIRLLIRRAAAQLDERAAAATSAAVVVPPAAPHVTVS